MNQPRIETTPDAKQWTFDLPEGYSAVITRMHGADTFRMTVRDGAGEVVCAVPVWEGVTNP